MVINLTIGKALEPFLSKPREKLHLSMISRDINVPHPTLRLWLNQFESLGILKKSYQGRLTLYSLNFDHPNLIDYLVIAEKNRLIVKSEDVILRELVQYVRKEDCEALIFGSSVVSIKNANDIDLLIIGKVPTKTKEISTKINKNIHLITLPSLEKVSKALKAEIVKKHLIINGSEAIMRWMLW